MSNTYYLSLGGNISPEKTLPAAVLLLRQFGQITAISTVFETTPLGVTERQPDYLNAALIIESDLGPQEFQLAIANIEHSLGRERTENKYAARPIDIDIMLVDDEILSIDHRQIPSPEILERNFVSIPLAEIAPEYVHPETHQKLREIAAGHLREKGPLRPRPDVRLNSTLDKSD